MSIIKIYSYDSKFLAFNILFGQIYEVLRQNCASNFLMGCFIEKKLALNVLIVRFFVFLQWGFPTERNSGFSPKLTISLAQARLSFYN